VQFDRPFRDRQPKACSSAFRPFIRSLHTVESVEDPRQITGGDPRPGVPDLDPEPLTEGLQPDVDPAPLGGVAESVVDDVLDRPLDQTNIGRDPEQLTGELNERVDELITTLQTTFEYLQDLGGNSSDLMDTQRPTIEEMLLNLQEATRNLKEFSRILAEQPDALIRGKGRHGRKDEGE